MLLNIRSRSCILIGLGFIFRLFMVSSEPEVLLIIFSAPFDPLHVGFLLITSQAELFKFNTELRVLTVYHLIKISHQLPYINFVNFDFLLIVDISDILDSYHELVTAFNEHLELEFVGEASRSEDLIVTFGDHF